MQTPSATPVHPSLEIPRLQDDIQFFSREIIRLEEVMAQRPSSMTQITLNVTRNAKKVTHEALDTWISLCARGPSLGPIYA